MLVNVPRLQMKLDQEGLDGLVATTFENVLYFTGIESVGLFIFPHTAQAYAIITRDAPAEPYYVASVGELDQALDAFPGLQGTVGYGRFFRETLAGANLNEEEQFLRWISVETKGESSPLDALVVALEKMGLADKRVGVDEVGLLPGYMEQLKERVKGEIHPATRLLQWVRMVKSDEEIRRVRAAAQMTEIALTAIKGVIRPGVSEYEIAREFERSVVSQGGKPKITLVRIGRNGISGQVLPGNSSLAQGDSVWFDLASTLNGYWADMARIYCLGEPSRRIKEFYQAMLVGEDAGIAAARAGMSGGELFALTVRAVRDAGVPHYQRHHVGHGIGAEIYDPPLLAPGIDIPLEDGMIINIETPYYEFGFGAVHVEDPFVVRAGGNELLTTFSRELHIIE
jgi:Xaa-Pro aminopeptidase